MVMEFNHAGSVTTEEALRSEHSVHSVARRVIDGPVNFPKDAEDDNNVLPINVVLNGTSAEMLMEVKKTYRLIGTAGLHFRLSRDASAAVVTDIYLPADTAIVIKAGEEWGRVSVIKAAGASDGIAQIVELR